MADDSGGFQSNSSRIRQAITHMFLTKETPGMQSSNLEEIEQFLLHTFFTSLQKAVVETPLMELYSVVEMFRTWDLIQPKSSNVEQASTFRREISNIEPGCTLPIYVRNQNSTLMITKQGNDLTISTFRSSLPADIVMSGVGSQFLQFPQTTEKIRDTKLIRSIVFAELVYELAVGGIHTLREIKKGEEKYAEVRDVADPRLVSDYIVGLLAPSDHANSQSEFKIRKKLRDQVTLQVATGSSKLLPFRRSGMYTSLKVVLQLKLLQQFSNLPEAKFVYKILMLRILTEICQQFFLTTIKNFDMDLGCQILAKLGGRVRKLEKYKLETRSLPHIEQLKTNCYQLTESVAEEINKSMKTHWNEISFKPLSKGTLANRNALVDCNYSDDIKHDIPELNKYIAKLKSIAPNRLMAAEETVPDPDPVTRYQNLNDIIESNGNVELPKDESLLKIWLLDVENFIKYNCPDNATPFQMSNILMTYLYKAKNAYKNNPLGISQMLLCALKAMQMIHEKVAKKHPLLQEYKTEISLEKLDHLVLPYRKDMELLNLLTVYFTDNDSRTPANAKSILERQIDDQSFAVKFASTNKAMEATRQRLLKKEENKAEEKMVEVSLTRDECTEIQNNIQKCGGKCTCQFETEQKLGEDGKLCTVKTKIIIVPKCKMCQLEDELKETRVSVTIYEKTLPADVTKQRAVIFESLIPEDYAIWRDLLAYFKYDLLGDDDFNTQNYCITLWARWMEMIGVRKPEIRHVWLGSTELPSKATYLGQLATHDVLISEKEQFVVDNCMNCFYNYKSLRYGDYRGKCVQTACTFQLSSTSNSGLPYSNLQSALALAKLSQNDIIAAQHSCSVKLSLREYVAFGSLRVGHRIQWRNLYESMHREALSLEKEPVLALVLQTIWQIGPLDTANERESHVDIEDNDFAEEFLDMLKRFVRNKSGNYNCPLVLLNAILIARRISELNDSLEQKCYNLVKDWRIILSRWRKEASEQIVMDNSNDVNASIKKLLLEINLCILFSFSVGDNSKLSEVIKDEESILHLITSIYHFFQLTSDAKNKDELSEFFKILLDHGEMLPYRIGIDSISTPPLLKAFKIFCKEKWPKIDECYVKSESVSNHGLIRLKLVEWISPRNRHQITFNIYTGLFLVDGYNQSGLPPDITGSKLFQEYFKHIENFRVQRDSSNVFTTVDTFRGRRYKIYVLEEGAGKAQRKSVVIKEIVDANTKLILLDPESLKLHHYISNYFIQNHTLWLDTMTNKIYFRAENASPDDIHNYELQLVSTGNSPCGWKLFDVKSRQYYFSILSPGFERIVISLTPLELSQYINVSINEQEEGCSETANLWRYNLRFAVKNNGCHESLEYSNFSICKNQSTFGTLIGLRQGLLLRNARKRIFLVPHSTIKLKPKLNKHQHHITEICLQTLRQPPLFVYEVDDVLKRLKAHNSKAAWLYLAALHAATSSSLPDPFTGMTGTEMAMHILQSGRVWSCLPYDTESLETLKFIKGLAPERTYYGFQKKKCKGETMVMESIEWPDGLSSMAAYDGYAIIVDKLIADSNRLEALYGKSKSDDLLEDDTVEVLRIRSYLRHLNIYNSGIAIERRFFTESQLSLLAKQEETLLESHKECISSNFVNLKSLMNVSNRLEDNNWPALIKCGTFQKNSLLAFIYTNEPLEPPLPELTIGGKNSFLDLFHLDFRSNWLKLYRMAIRAQDANMFAIILASFAHRGVPIEQIVNLQVIFSFAKSRVEFLQLPKDTPEISDITHHIFKRASLQQIICNCVPFPLKEPKKSKPDTRSGQYDRDVLAYNTQKELYDQDVKQCCSEIADFIESQWPCKQFNSKELIIRHLGHYRADPKQITSSINGYLQYLQRNNEMKIIMDSVQDILNSIYDKQESKEMDEDECQPKSSRLSRPATSIQFEGHNDFVGSWKLNEFICSANIGKDRLGKAEQIYRTGKLPVNLDRICHSLTRQRRIHLAKIRELTRKILQMITVSSAGRITKYTGIIPRLSPISLLRHLLGEDCKSGELIKNYIGALGVTCAHLKRINRCLAAKEIDSSESDAGHENWSPQNHPEWLLLELELDIMIRPVQVDVANQMTVMPDANGNGVTQLNMGQGKTSVIVPMLCSTLAQRNSQLCRVTILASMFKMNLNSLTFAIGGLLNRRVYSFPFRRDTIIDQKLVRALQMIYEECLNEQGVVITLPEHRLSFRLLAHDKILKSEKDLGIKILTVENWLRKYARDVLDESDELLSVKYQLVYTVGNQAQIDGGDLRWTVCQEVLRIVQKVGAIFWKAFGPDAVEFDDESFQNFPHQFATFRLLKQSHMKHFIQSVADILIAEFNDMGALTGVIKDFLVNNPKSKDYNDRVIQGFNYYLPNKSSKLLLLSGYLRRGILELALTKRWRVEYGVNPKQELLRRMAVPFRAKDVAAEKTEFGHPDLAIVLTHLSYYYSGLNDVQLEEVFEYMKAREEPAARYSSWISLVPEQLVGDNFPRQYNSLNMKDVQQKSAVFDLLRKHKSVIDYWLSACVFPHESKQFPGKLVMTAWDLCYERQQHPVTGFSGTNDSLILLPLTISQQDLPELQNTNDRMEQILRRVENGNHKGLRMGVTCREILESMKNDKLSVLIDAGALMLELSNEQVADCWLKLNPEIEAVAYFSKDDDLVVKCRGRQGIGHQGTPFDVSPYKGHLDKCGVFLDDQHTRGTDLKFPVNSRACVTIGARMKRDKLIQACMRMRKLGEGHSVSFYLSHEAVANIIVMERESYGGVITTDAVLKWVKSNTRQFNEDGLLYWAMAAKNYAQRLVAEDNFHWPNYECPEIADAGEGNSLEEKANVLSRQCVDDEVLSLIDMYGQYTKEQLLTQVIPEWFNTAMQMLKEKCPNTPMNPKVLERFDEICSKVLSRCREYAGNKTVVTSSKMEEEQERKLELEKAVEVEEERIVKRPIKHTSANPSLHENVKEYVLQGGRLQEKDGILPLAHVFEHTTFWKELNQGFSGWKSVFVTSDFCSVILGINWMRGAHSKTDFYLRPVNYLVSWRFPADSGDLQLLVLSHYEVNELMPYFRDGQVKCKLHMFSLRRTEKQDLLLNNRRLQLPVKLRGKEMIPNACTGTMALMFTAGNLYFVTREELEGFAEFTKQAFVDENNVVSLVTRILHCRHPVVSEVAHVMLQLNGKYVDLPSV